MHTHTHTQTDTHKQARKHTGPDAQAGTDADKGTDGDKDTEAADKGAQTQARRPPSPPLMSSAMCTPPVNLAWALFPRRNTTA